MNLEKNSKYRQYLRWRCLLAHCFHYAVDGGTAVGEQQTQLVSKGHGQILRLFQAWVYAFPAFPWLWNTGTLVSCSLQPLKVQSVKSWRKWVWQHIFYLWPLPAELSWKLLAQDGRTLTVLSVLLDSAVLKVGKTNYFYSTASTQLDDVLMDTVKIYQDKKIPHPKFHTLDLTRLKVQFLRWGLAILCGLGTTLTWISAGEVLFASQSHAY